ncbi:Flp pilus assembly protein TadD [Maritimibacter alkaliphilus HTCC2654]|uniref:TPR domain protein n=1 Tax=Maritimibacter alkaliphilus HTCC2654 TaxID=314271 RepID=A3VB70_9RHOB|nr:tetratricopeptide repeat protein [Maritimibacter alkaliphilus]EAQ14203.1 TPR domain protein [Rhodobacterales bacterium HTCC2654] [Maritimibacter alkaliphilus HTCC2654]TYP82657.1 Flp pilus assembly protein TadD [Maritimibacter alkaliphilus HTCC2654]
MPRLFQTARTLGVASFLALTALPISAQSTDGFTGAYLAARSADANADFEALVEYGTRALAERPDNAGIMEGLLVAHLGLGQIDQAVPVARRLVEMSEGNELGQIVLLGDAMGREDWAAVEDTMNGGFSVGGLMDPLILAWTAIGDGRMSRALEVFEELSQDDVAKQVSAFQKAQALAYVGDYEGAAAILSGEAGVELALNRSGVIAYAQILSQLERNNDAIALLDAQLPNTGDEEIAMLRAELESGATVEFDSVKSPKDGLSALFYNVAEVLANDASPSLVLIYARLSQFLDPENVSATLLCAAVFEDMQNHELAVQTYDQIAPDSRAYVQAMMGKASALRRSDQAEAGIETLTTLADRYPDLAPVHVALGDAYRYEEAWPEAIAAYDRAISLYPEEVAAQWAVYFARGIVNERGGRWEDAERDFRKALELEPDQPSVLNYLGYSLVEKRENLDEALGMIEKAVDQRPNEGYIVDSLGWVYYRLGRYDEAVPQMEKAVSLMPVDPVVNDHLGDVYWAVGRTREAEFQWSRALSFITDETNLEEVKPDRIRRKLEVGLDKVLEEEGGDPILRQESAAAN